MSTGLPPGVLDDFNSTEQGHYACLVKWWLQMPPHPRNDTSEMRSPAWAAAGIAPPKPTPCTMFEAQEDPTIRCVPFPSRMDQAVFNMGTTMVPSPVNGSSDEEKERNCAAVCAAQSVEAGAGGENLQKCSAITTACQNNGDEYGPNMNCYPPDPTSTPDERSCPKGGYIYDSSKSTCACASAAMWWLTGEVSPYDALNAADQAKLNTAYDNLGKTSVTNTTTSDVFNFVAVADGRQQLAMCRADAIKKKNDQDTNQQIMKAVIALVGALIMMFIVYKIVRIVYKSHQA